MVPTPSPVGVDSVDKFCSGATLRGVGSVTSVVGKEVVVPTVKGVTKFWAENEVGYKSRALLELGLKSAILSSELFI